MSYLLGNISTVQFVAYIWAQKIKLKKIANQRSHLKGLTKIHISNGFLLLITETIPDSEYGSDKSTYDA